MPSLSTEYFPHIMSFFVSIKITQRVKYLLVLNRQQVVSVDVKENKCIQLRNNYYQI